MEALRVTNKLLLIIVIALVLYIIKVLAFIFIPLMLAVLFALLLMPIMRGLIRRKIPDVLAIVMVCLLVVSVLFGVFKIAHLSIDEIVGGRKELYQKLDDKLGETLASYSGVLELEPDDGRISIKDALNSRPINSFIINHLGASFTIVQKTLSITALTVFFLILLLAGSVKMEVVMNETLFNDERKTLFTYLTIEKSIGKFLAVKTLMSLLTGLGFTAACWFFDVSFPIFWGFLAFALNYIQLAGSVFCTALLALYGIVEIEATGSLLIFISILIGLQILFGSVIEPIMLGRSFSINVITVLIMLMFWGFLLGIPGMILAIPITVFVKILLQQFDRTKKIAKLLS